MESDSIRYPLRLPTKMAQAVSSVSEVIPWNSPASIYDCMTMIVETRPHPAKTYPAYGPLVIRWTFTASNRLKLVVH
jgi:hypothetical protein